MIRACWSMCLLASFASASAQRTPVFQVHHYMPEQGLSNRHVTALVQDNIGFVWAGTVSGLDRLDGHAVRNWSVSDGLSGGRVDVLRRDGDGLIWAISTDISNDIKTIDVMDPRAGVLQPFAERFARPPFDPSDLVRIGPQRTDGSIVLGAASPARCIVYQRGGIFKVIPVDGQRFEPLGDDKWEYHRAHHRRRCIAADRPARPRRDGGGASAACAEVLKSFVELLHFLMAWCISMRDLK